jgi:hypothetical protein
LHWKDVTFSKRISKASHYCILLQELTRLRS